MRISSEQLDEFIMIYKEAFGEEVGRSQAEDMASELLHLYETLISRRPTDVANSEDVSEAS
jgi:hypothetical protein